MLYDDSIEIISPEKADKSFLELRNLFDSNSTYEIENIKINFKGIDEPHYGNLILKFEVFDDSNDITNIISKDGYCLPMKVDFIDSINKLIYFPYENKITLYKISSKETINIIYPVKLKSLRNIYKVNNCLICLFNNGYLSISLDNLEFQFQLVEKIDFVSYIEEKEFIFTHNFTQLNGENIFHFFPKIESNSFDDFVEKSYIDSQKGFLWGNGFKNSQKHQFSNFWELIGYNDLKKEMTLVKSIILDEGTFDETERIMWFTTENKYLKVLIKNFR